MIDITLNGEKQVLPSEMTVRELLTHLGLGAGRVAVELNRAVVKRDRYAEQIVTAGDTVEIVHFVGGG